MPLTPTTLCVAKSGRIKSNVTMRGMRYEGHWEKNPSYCGRWRPYQWISYQTDLTSGQTGNTTPTAPLSGTSNIVPLAVVAFIAYSIFRK